MLRKNTARAYTALAAGVVAISWSAIFVRWTHMSGVSSAFYRVLIAALLLAPLALSSRRGAAPLSRKTWWLAGLGGVFFAGDVGLYNVAVLRTSASSATLLGNSAPLLVGLLTWAMTRRLPSVRFWVALMLALAGGALLVVADSHGLNAQGQGMGPADLLAVLSSCCFGFYLVTTEKVRGACDTTMLLAISSAASAGSLLVVALVGGMSLAVPGVGALGALVGLGVVCQVFGYFCLTYALGHLPATVTSVILLGVAPLTALLALMLFGEKMGWVQMVGGAMVLAGIWIVSRSRGGVTQG